TDRPGSRHRTDHQGQGDREYQDHHRGHRERHQYEPASHVTVPLRQVVRPGYRHLRRRSWYAIPASDPAGTPTGVAGPTTVRPRRDAYRPRKGDAATGRVI